MSARPILLLLPLALAACNREPSVAIRTDDGTQVSVGDGAANVVADNGAVALRTTGDQVSVRLPGISADVKVPGLNLDAGDMDIDGMKLHPGTKLAGLTADGAGGGGQVRLNFTDDAAPAQVARHYREAAPAAGWRLDSASDARVAATKGGAGAKHFEILLYPAGNGTRGTITVADAK